MIKLSLDGDQWCALIGENLQVGEAGFGDDPVAALRDLRLRLTTTQSSIPNELLEWEIGDSGDGYHTFNELYEHRHLLFCSIVSSVVVELQHTKGFFSDNPVVWKSHRHHDGTAHEGWFIAGLKLSSGDISYHLPDRLWGVCLAPERPLAPKWDGHNSKDVLDRMAKWIGIENQ